MDVKTYSHARQNLAELMDEVCDNRAPVVVTRQGAKSVVILPLEEYESMEETLYLLRSPANAARLYGSIEQLKRGKVVRRDPTKQRRKKA
ncbi:MAG: type II toxin-antitoxin system Phd/YefM family antitoxin [Micropepsaceae bacterium]